ncbi:Flavoprotein wrbA; trp repressor-binding protein (fragment) [Agrobacterium deltaense NCPPB 1641]|uniref:Flavoprotein wrbA trp repressor-binding protein n=1 Tax=Agrobacterium deltaense NCPPB 1641 TaxID=1183425 RepID=A0A1S7UB76_9HYPH
MPCLAIPARSSRPIATVGELADYEGIIVSAGTCFGTVASHAKFLRPDRGLWSPSAMH